MNAEAPEANPDADPRSARPAISLPNRRSFRSRRWLTAGAILLVVLVSYSPIFHAGFIWDDDRHITTNLLLRNADGLQTMWLDRTALPQYYPLTHTFFWVEHHLWGDNPLGYHVINILLHGGIAILVLSILRRLAIPGALFAALLFAVHPVNVETVAWISERKNTLSGFFYMLSLLAFLHFDKREASSRSSNFYLPAIYLLSLLLFVCSLLCKSVTCTLPAAILIILWWRDGRVRLREAIALLPFIVIGAAMGLQTAWLERTHVASAGPEWRFASTIPGEVVARCLIAGRVVWFYLCKLVVPYPLMFEYPRWHVGVAIIWQYAFPAAAIMAIVALLMLRKRIGRGPLAAALFFVVTLFPALGFANLYPMRFSFVADHFQYLASIGPLTLIAAGIVKLSMRRAGEIIPAELVVGGLMILTLVRCFAFASEVTLYSDSISKNPDGWMTQTNLGAALGREGDLTGATLHLMAGLRLHPINGLAADKLGAIAEVRRQDDDAVAWFRRAIALEPKLPAPHYDLAVALERRGDIAGALKEYQITVQLQHNHAPAHLNYGVLLGRQGAYAEAATQFREALRIDPSSTLARRDLLAALERSSQYDEAEQQIHLLLEKLPNDASLYQELGLVEIARHNASAAMAAFSHALAIDPQLTESRQHLNALISPPSAQP